MAANPFTTVGFLNPWEPSWTTASGFGQSRVSCARTANSMLTILTLLVRRWAAVARWWLPLITSTSFQPSRTPQTQNRNPALTASSDILDCTRRLNLWSPAK